MNSKNIVSISLSFVLLLFSSAASQATTQQDLPNFQRLHNYLSRGGAPTTKGIELLRKRNFGTVIDLRAAGRQSTEEQPVVERLGMKYLNIPVGDAVPNDQQISLFCQRVEGAEPEHNTDWIPQVYVHGDQGRNATSCLIGIWRVTHEGWTDKRAVAEMISRGFDVHHKDMLKVVQEYADGTKKL